MNEERALKLQAYLDGEMAENEVADFEASLARDPELQALQSELSFVSKALRDSDPVVAVPESREFYFSQIQRRIEAAEAASDRETVGAGAGWMSWLRRAMLPLSGVAAACLMLVVSLREGTLPVRSFHEETESPIEETAAVTFRSEAEKVTIVWLYDRQVASADTTTVDDGN